MAAESLLTLFGGVCALESLIIDDILDAAVWLLPFSIIVDFSPKKTPSGAMFVVFSFPPFIILLSNVSLNEINEVAALPGVEVSGSSCKR